jgi:anti-sigma factor RsiW
MENCQLIDLKSYNFGEVTTEERRAAEAHLKSCASCRDELGRLQLLGAALGALRDEEPPRRIAFVSDKVFEPAWWQRFWASGPKAGFAASALLAGAILAHAFIRPPAAVQTAPVTNVAAGAAVSDADLDQRIARAVAEVEKRQQEQLTQVRAALEKKYELESRALAIAEDDNQLLRKQVNAMHLQQAGLVKD